MRWRKILHGSLARKALESALCAGIPTDPGFSCERRENSVWGKGTNASSSLAEGMAGEAILAAALAATSVRTKAFTESAVARVCRAAAATSIEGRDSSFFSGFPGVAWCGSRLQRATRKLSRFCSEADVTVDRLVSRPIWESEFDLVNGLVGYGVYALERLPRPAAVQALRKIVLHLATVAEPVEGGLAWRTPALQIPPELRRGRPKGHFDLGMAHGAAGIVAFLAQAVAAGVEAGVARNLLEGGVSWLLAHKTGSGASRFPFWVVPGQAPGGCRAAWCYGDPGIAASLLLAARLVGEPSWEREALGIARQAAGRDPGTAGVTDHGLCHGSAGLGHVFNRLYQATGDEELRRTAVSWFEETLATSRPDSPRSPNHDESRERPVAAGALDRSFLTGTSGTGLALFAAATQFEPAWDRVLLLSSAFSSQNARRVSKRRTGAGDRNPAPARRRPPAAPRRTGGRSAH